MTDHHGAFLLLLALAAIIALIVLIARFKINPFISLFTISLALAAASGMPLQTIVKSFETGVGGILGHIAIVVALGTMLGKMMAESGGADRIARTLINIFGEKHVAWAMVVVGFVVGLPVFFEVGFVLLVPIAFNIARRTGTSLVLIGLPMVAGLSVVHGLVPPHPAAMLAVTIYNADIGRTIFFAMIVGIPTAIIAGPLYAKFIAPRILLAGHNPIAEQFIEEAPRVDLPSFGLTVATILLPIVLMLVGSWADIFSAPQSRLTAFCICLVAPTFLFLWLLS
jgi:gluconate:H+ symporter, GntP family